MSKAPDLEYLSWFAKDLRRLALEAVNRGAEAAVEPIREFEERDSRALISALATQKARLLNPSHIVDRLMDPPERQSPAWFASRLALLGAISKPSVAGRSVFVSISHIDSIAAAIACEIQEYLLGIGVDIEPADRKLSMSVLRRIRSSLSGTEEVELVRWVRFEAAYKSDPRSGMIPLKEYRFSPPSRFTRKGATVGSYVISDPNLEIVVGVAACWSERPMP